MCGAVGGGVHDGLVVAATGAVVAGRDGVLGALATYGGVSTSRCWVLHNGARYAGLWLRLWMLLPVAA